ncbi:unnamed protein product [Orchesella dallaii]|uniref:C2H2-type domain-containing protein n=1 Tax=Orchesella dallaii TaxID=48710 RepID=A0ABP1RMH7_9HEXA
MGECDIFFSYTSIALRPNFWGVDDSNPKYLLYKQEYVSKYKCNRCPAEYFDEADIKEHSKLHEENEVDLRTSCDWIVAPGKMKEHEEKHHRSLGSEEFPVSSLLWKQVKYWKCKECQGKLLEEDKEEIISGCMEVGMELLVRFVGC